MHYFKTLLYALACLACALASGPALAQNADPLSDGEIRKVDKEASKITIKHGVIKSLDMPAMTMVFTVKNAALLDQVKPGDKVRFNVAREEGKLVLTEVQTAP